MRKLFPLVGFLLAACAATPNNQPVAPQIERSAVPDTSKISDREAFAGARKAVLAKLKDPESARFGAFRRSVSVGANGQRSDEVCGTVNAKNSFGGYTGSMPFVYAVGEVAPLVMANNPEISDLLPKGWCGQ